MIIALITVQLVLPYLVGPFLVWRKRRFPVTVSFDTLLVEQLPAVVRRAFQSQVTALEYDGFSLAAYVKQSNSMPSQTTILAMMTNRNTGDVALLIDITTTVG